jgi:cytoskeletal protein CcmA (bactofilin family)
MLDRKPKSDNDFLGKVSRIAEGTIIKGEIVSQADFRFDGELIGNFKSNGKIIIGVNGRVSGNIVCKSADIEGRFEGKIKVDEILNLKATGQIKGEISCGSIAVELGTKLDISCLMNEKNQVSKSGVPVNKEDMHLNKKGQSN